MPNASYPSDDADDLEFTDADLDQSEEGADYDPGDVPDDLGDFDEKDFASRIAGWDFKAETRYDVGPDSLEVEAYYRRRKGARPGTKWERFGHIRSDNALDCRRLVHCAALRDKREQEAGRDGETVAQRRRAIEGLFGPGAHGILESLMMASDLSPPAERGDKSLTPRQEAFCRHYLSEPSGTRAAILAGYAEKGAATEAHRLLRNAEILQKISALRRQRALAYALDRDTVLDKLEWVFEEAMKAQSHSAALRALLAQAEVSGLLNRRHKATERAEARACAEAAQPPAMSAIDEKG